MYVSKVIEENAAALERIEKLYMQGLENAKKNYDSAAKAETGEEAADNKKAADGSGVKYSIAENYVDSAGNKYDEIVVLDTNIFNGIKSRNWGRALLNFVKNDLAGTQVTAFDKNGSKTIIEFAKPKERVKKDGAKNSHIVIDELGRKHDRNSQLAAAHAVEIIQVSDFNGTNSTHNHQWLDENGWEYRKVHLIDKSGNIYSATLNIGLAKDGRKILYDINKISNIGHGVVPSASKKKRGSHINPDVADKSIISRSDTDVKQKFSLSDPLNAAFNQDVQDKFEKDVDDVLNGKYTSDDPLMLGTTPTVFRQIGLSALPVVITKNHVYSIAATEAQAKADGKYSKKVNYHGLGAQTVKQIYSKISNPLAIIAAQDITVSPGVYSAHRVVAIVDLSINGKQVIAPVEVDADVVYQKDKLDVNLVATYYDKNNIASMLKNAVSLEQSGGVGFYYIDKKRAANLLKQTGVQFPSRLVANNSNGIIHQVDEKVNRKIDTVLKSRQFIRWFGDWQNSPETASKVVNEDGTPKVVYHGTNADFTVFDLSKSGQTAPGISDGFFFFTDRKSNYPNSASDYANSTSRKGGTPKVYEVYLSIKNPLYIDSKGYYDNIAYFDTHSDEIYSTYFSGDYDGVIISNSDKSADDSTLYLLDNASAIKSATDNIGTFDGSNPDIRYSLENTSSIDYPALLKENTDLKKQNEALAAEMKLTEGHKVSRGAVEKLAGKILREYKSGYDKTVLADNLEKVFNYIADENADAAQAMDVLSSVAKAVIEQSSEIDASLSEQFSKSLR